MGSQELDLVIKGGKIVDGTGNPWFKADIGVKDGKIIKLGRLEYADFIIDANDKVVCPGFIDMHNHTEKTCLIDPKVESMIQQGITTMVIGQCGGSVAPINPNAREELIRCRFSFLPEEAIRTAGLDWVTYREYLARIEEKGCSCNLATLVGHGTIRLSVMGFEARKPTDRELGLMKMLVEEAMQAGAFGLSSGLYYPPGVYAETDELVELCRVVAKYRGTYFTHIRGESDTLIDSVKEAIEIGERSGVPVQISHLKVAGAKNWGKSPEVLKIIEDARKRGVDVTFDQYPYTAGMTGLSALLPPWARVGGDEMMIKRLKDPNERRRIKNDFEKGLPGWQNTVGDVGWSNIYLAFVEKEENKFLEGKNFKEISNIKNCDPASAYFDLLIDEKGKGSIVVFMMSEDDVVNIMKSPFQMFGTDGWAVSPKGILSHGKPHPRFYGTYPRVLGRYVRDMGVLRLEEAIRKMTSLPAQKLGLRDRGLLREGFWADIVIFDPEKIMDKATYQNPHQFPEGIEHVIVNGTVVVSGGEHNGALPGKVLRLKKNKL